MQIRLIGTIGALVAASIFFFGLTWAGLIALAISCNALIDKKTVDPADDDVLITDALDMWSMRAEEIVAHNEWIGEHTGDRDYHS